MPVAFGLVDNDDVATFVGWKDDMDLEPTDFTDSLCCCKVCVIFCLLVVVVCFTYACIIDCRILSENGRFAFFS